MTEPAAVQHHVACLRAGLLVCAAVSGLAVAACAPMKAPDPRSINIPAPTPPEERRHAVNEAPDGVLVLPLGRDVLVPAMDQGDTLPDDPIGPFELRHESLAAALQLLLEDYDIPLAFEGDEGMTGAITVTNLKGPLAMVVETVCSLADMYCLYDDGVLTVKENHTFTVSLPPLATDAGYDAIVAGLKAFTGAEGTVDTTTRTLIYTATQRTAKQATQYFGRLRKSTAMIVYETYIWEVGLTGGNSAGIKWSQLNEQIGAYNLGFSLSGNATPDLGTPISIGLPTRGAVNLSTGDILEFISSQGSIKTISQPQLTVLSGSEATLRVAETEAYVESLTRSQNTSSNTETVSTTTGTVDTGFTLKIASSWDNGTVYGNVDINLQQLLEFQNFPAGNESSLRLPKTAERELQTQVRVRPGDSVLIAGLVRERQHYGKTGLGLTTPLLPFSRSGQSSNTELVILLRPRVVVYKAIEEIDGHKIACDDRTPARKVGLGRGRLPPIDDTPDAPIGSAADLSRLPPLPSGLLDEADDIPDEIVDAVPIPALKPRLPVADHLAPNRAAVVPVPPRKLRPPMPPARNPRMQLSSLAAPHEHEVP